jgi:hypothetical protein
MGEDWRSTLSIEPGLMIKSREQYQSNKESDTVQKWVTNLRNRRKAVGVRAVPSALQRLARRRFGDNAEQSGKPSQATPECALFSLQYASAAQIDNPRAWRHQIFAPRSRSPSPKPSPLLSRHAPVDRTVGSRVSHPWPPSMELGTYLVLCIWRNGREYRGSLSLSLSLACVGG